MAHIAIITTSFPVDDSGAESAGSFVADFAQELGARARVTVLAPGPENSEGRRGRCAVRFFRVPRLPLSLLNPLNPADWPAISGTLLGGMKALDELHLNQPCDHLFALWALPSGFWARRVMKQSGVSYSVWALGSDIWSLGRLPYIRTVLKKVLKDSRCCFADGYRLREEVEILSGRGCCFLPSARRLDKAGKNEMREQPPYRLAFLGRWHPNKGVDLLMEALARLADDEWRGIAEIRIHGGGPLAELVVASAGRLKKAGRPVVTGGYLDKNQAAELILWADYLLIPSRIESIPVIYSDAVQCGTPVIAMPAGDLPVLLGKYNTGILAAETSSRAFHRAIGDALKSSPSEFNSGMNQARQIFDMVKIVDRFLEYARIEDTAPVPCDSERVV